MKPLVALLLLFSAGLPGRAVAQRSSRDAARFDDSFRKYAKRYFGVGYDWRVFKAQAIAESQLDPEARSGVGARGLMQLMPTTFRQIQSRNPDFRSIDDPEWNIAAGIQYDRTLWKLWNEQQAEVDLRSFMFASYNAGRGTILRAQDVARVNRLEPRKWSSIEIVAPRVQRWRHQETLGYLRKIASNVDSLLRSGATGRRR